MLFVYLIIIIFVVIIVVIVVLIHIIISFTVYHSAIWTEPLYIYFCSSKTAACCEFCLKFSLIFIHKQRESE